MAISDQLSGYSESVNVIFNQGYRGFKILIRVWCVVDEFLVNEYAIATQIPGFIDN
ncbi:hypothetical protein [Brunnivagina elsteri]|uniref:hypothetical protein n=1 Tax=Brunnivagina elsteri TaxID=1247191 RepID=UPI0013046941|nr:hypothetical protein [Calothrix elsteri]